MDKADIAIVIAAFNRPHSLKRLLNSLEISDYSGFINITLYLSIDYSDNHDCFHIASSFNWIYGKKNILTHKVNLGLRKHILSCGDLVKHHDAIIVLEDDLFVSPQYYQYSQAAYNFFKNDDRIAGISLYNYRYNEFARCSFEPITDGFDNYFMQVPSSWGQMWLKSHWNSFTEYLKVESFENEADLFLPDTVFDWEINRSWKRSFYKYMVINEKYFVYPRYSLSSNFGDSGTNVFFNYDVFQSNILINKIDYKFSDLVFSLSVYDSFFELDEKTFNRITNRNESVSFDLYGLKPLNKVKTEFLFSIKECNDYSKKFDFRLYPYENNIILNLLAAPSQEVIINYAPKNQFKKSVGFDRIKIELKRLFADENPYIKLGKDEVYKTTSYRIGHAILYPIRWYRRLFYKKKLH